MDVTQKNKKSKKIQKTSQHMASELTVAEGERVGAPNGGILGIKSPSSQPGSPGSKLTARKAEKCCRFAVQEKENKMGFGEHIYVVSATL